MMPRKMNDGKMNGRDRARFFFTPKKFYAYTKTFVAGRILALKDSENDGERESSA
jgi:hypothetical protein